MLQKKNYLLTFIILCVWGCKKEVKTTFSETKISSKNNTIVEVFVPKAAGNETVASQINLVIDQSISNALQIGEPNKITSHSAEKSIANFNKEYEKFKNDFPETKIPWEAQVDGEVVYQSPEIISLAITSYVNTGGAHGLSKVKLLNFDAVTGKILTKEQLITDIEAFKKIAKPYFDQTIAEKDGATFNTDDFNLPANIAYTESGIVLLYNTYEIAPYSTGIIEFTIPFDEAMPYLSFN